jgi:AcrR family transcriptional regulator
MYVTGHFNEFVSGDVTMDRRQQKTRTLIFQAFKKLLETKRYSNITVQEIIDEANVGRSTFYAHFETKDELLKALCTEIFSHVFSDDLMSEKTHDFSGRKSGLEARITHLLYHLNDNKHDIIGILSCESGELFMRYFKQYLAEMFSKYLNELNANVPADFLLNHLTGSFAEAVTWWINSGMKNTPEEISKYYMSVI